MIDPDLMKVTLEAFDSSRGRQNNVLFVDSVGESEPFALAIKEHDPGCSVRVLRDDPHDLWLVPARSYRFVVVSAPREAADLYRVTYFAARLVDVGGAVFILSQGSASRDRPRDASSYVFLGAYPEFQWALTRVNALLLRKLS